ncbi:hypothetical protein [Pseudoneobacillus sp. C159]
MDAFYGLLKKEWKLSRVHIFIGIVILLTLLVAGYLVSVRIFEPIYYFFGVSGLLFLHIFYIPIIFGISLHGETKQLQLWLHTPQKVTSLVTAKLLVATVGYIFSFIIIAIATKYAFDWNVADFKNADVFTVGNVISVTIMLFLSSLSIGIIFLFCTAINLWQKKYIRRFQNLSLIIIIVVLYLATSFLEQTVWFATATNWLQINVPINKTIDITTHSISVNKQAIIYVGDIVYQVGKYLFLFFFSCYVIDKKVEV